MTDLSCDASVLDHCPRIGDESAHGASDVSVNLHDLLDGIRLEQR